MAEVPKLFERLFDDAAVFPPGNAPLPAAISHHAGHRRSWYAATVGPLVVPAARIDDVVNCVETGLELALTGRSDDPYLDNYIAVASRHAQLKVRALELVIQSDPGATSLDESLGAAARIASALGADTEVFIEDPAHSTAVLDALAAQPTPMMAKLRAGGVVASAFPSEAQLAGWIADCMERRLPFKCTAGLHHAVRHTASDTGFEHHGFLNVILAVGAAIDAAAPEDLVAALSLRDHTAVVEEVSRLSPSIVAEIRERFVSFGTCSVTEPIDDLLALELLARPE